MTEQEFIKALERMEKPITGKSAEDYAADLGIKRRLTKLLQAEGYLQPGQCALDLMEADPETVAAVKVWKESTKLSARPLAALNRLLEIYSARDKDADLAVRRAVSMKQPSMKPAAVDKNAEPKLSLYALLNAMLNATKNYRTFVEKHTYKLLMEALLLTDDFFWNSDTTEADLHVWGSRYEKNAQKILANLKDTETRNAVVCRMKDALVELVDFDTKEILQDRIAHVCANIETEMEDWYIKYLKQASDYPDSQARLLLHQLASMEKGAGKELYSDMTLEELAEKTVDLFELALLAADGYYPPAPDPKQAMHALTEEEQDMLAAAGCGLPVRQYLLKDAKWKAELVLLAEKGLLWADGETLVLAHELKIPPLRRLADGSGHLKKGHAGDLLLTLLEKEKAGRADSDNIVTLLNHLKDLAGLLAEGNERDTMLTFLTKWYWQNTEHLQPRQSIYAIEQLLGLMEKYYDNMLNILARVLGVRSRDTKLRLTVRNGAVLLEGELLAKCAERCLELARSEDKGGYWAASAVICAQKALQKLELAGEPFVEMDTWLLLAVGYALQAAEEAGRPEDKWPYSAETLTREYWIPCLEALEHAEEILKYVNPERAAGAKERLAFMTEVCHSWIAETESPLRRCLASQSDTFEEDFGAGKWFDREWVSSRGLDQVECRRDLLQVMHRQDRPAKLFLPWYCNTFDSTLACGPVCTQEVTEASLLNILLSGQKVTLSANQLVDNEYMWNLAQVPAFLWLMRNGYVSVSMFGKLNSLMEYAVTRMDNPNFYWSSLPDDFKNTDLRNLAAAYFRGHISAAELPYRFREILVRMKDGIRLMDENLSGSWMGYYHQADEDTVKLRGIKPMIPLAQRVAGYYSVPREIEHYYEMVDLNQILLKANPQLDRSVYRKMLWAIEAENIPELLNMGIDLSALNECGLDVNYLAAERKDMMKDMIRIIDDCQNRMLGERISCHQYYVYDEAAARIVPEWHAGPVGDSGKLLYRQIEKQIEEDGYILGWGQVPERIMDLERLAEENPKADAEKLCSRLSSMGLSDYGIFGLDDSVRLKKLAFRASSGTAVGREHAEEKDQGDLFQVERNLNKESENN